jgi:hypothetical protein
VLDALLFVLGDAELDALDDRKLLYRHDRAAWSCHPNDVLDQLDRIHGLEDVAHAPNEWLNDDANSAAEDNSAGRDRPRLVWP